MAFLRALLLYGGILLAFTLPIAVLAPKKGQPETVRRFLVVAGILTLMAASVEAGSDLLVSKCEAVGNTACYDYGGLGRLLLFVIPYGVVAGVKAYGLNRE